MSLPANAYVILGMLGMGARSGYDIRRAAARSTRVFWTLSPAQIYPLLKDLEGRGLVEGRSDPVGRRKRRLYELTPEGRTALEGWLGDIDAELPFEVRDVATLKLFFADLADPADARRLVRSMRERSVAIVEYLERESEPRAVMLRREGQPYPLRVLGIGLAIHRAIIEHCSRIEAELSPSQRG